MASNSLAQLAQTVIARSKALVNNDLKKICKEEGQIQTGNKKHLQDRIFQLINDAVQRGDSETIRRIQHRVNHRGLPPPESTTQQPAALPYGSSSSPNLTHRFPNTNGHGSQATNGFGIQPHLVTNAPNSMFKDSPFYQFREQVLKDITLDASPSHRQTATRSLSLTEAQCQRLRSDSTLRLLLFSAMDPSLTAYTRLDVAFPAQIEVKVNGDEVRANFKGLKNKPGSTRPADITDLVRKVAHYKNQIQITFALTQKKYVCYVYLVKKDSVDDLANRIRQRNVITTQTVINEMRKKADDPDIEVGSVNLSLKDPISTLRISMPIRSTLCSHNACFDAASFLQLQEQAPTWQCPICNKTVSYEALAVDQYVQEILDQVSKTTDQVTIDPNGKWSSANNATQTPKRNGYHDSYNDESDEDLVEIPDYRIRSIKSEAIYTPQSLAQTPSLSSREASSVPRTGNKRKSEVIDLTLSDEDDEPARPAKKVNSYHTPSSLPDPSRRYQVPSLSRTSAPQHPQAHQHYQSMPVSMRVDAPPSSSQTHHGAYGQYRTPAPRQSFSGQGTSTYPTYLGSSP